VIAVLDDLVAFAFVLLAVPSSRSANYRFCFAFVLSFFFVVGASFLCGGSC
jgi:hypothetical protein